MRFTPENITELKNNEIFVFGSNLAGRHGAGAAKIAREKFRAVYGVGKGLTGRCYAFPTKDRQINPLPLESIRQEFIDLFACCENFPKYTFLLTKVGCGLAGYSIKEISGCYEGLDIPVNLVVPEEFWLQYHPLDTGKKPPQNLIDIFSPDLKESPRQVNLDIYSQKTSF